MGNKIVAINIPEEIWDELVKQNGSVKLELDDAQNLVVSEDEILKWPTAQYVVWSEYLWEANGGGQYVSTVGILDAANRVNLDPEIRDEAYRFAREAVPVTPVPEGTFALLCESMERDLIDLEDLAFVRHQWAEFKESFARLAQEVAR